MNRRRWQEAWTWFRRDLQHGELTLLLLALVLAVAATSSLRFFSSGLEKKLRLDAARLIAADLVVRSSRPLADAVLAEARKLPLRRTRTLEFSSVLIRGDRFQLAAVKAVATGYPLRGDIQLRSAGGDRPARGIPAPGTVWVDGRLLALLDARIGDTLQLGDRRFRIAAVIAAESDRSNFISLSPRALMNLDDVAATGVIQPGSRLQYQLLLAGPEAAIADFRAAVKPVLGVGARLLDAAGGLPEVASPLLQVSRYLGLAAMMTVLLSGLAIAVTARRFAAHHFDTLALMRCLGATRAQALRPLLAEMLLLWIFATALGMVIGLLAAQLISHFLETLLPGGMPVLTLWPPLLTGVATATLALAGFALPPLAALGRVTPLRVLRRELAPPPWSALAMTTIALAALLLLVILETGETELAAIVIGGGAVLTLILHRALAWMLVRLRHRFTSPLLAGLVRDAGATATQVLGLATGLAALLLMISLRGELLASWQQKLPAAAPNQFAINIPAESRDAFTAALQADGLQHAALFPVIRARLTRINGQAVQTLEQHEDDTPSRRDESLRRELNLTWSATLPPGNRIVSGHWQPVAPASGAAPVSIEKKLAERLGIGPGDHLHFALAEGELDAVVSSVRAVDWDSFQPNFYFVFPPGTLDRFPASYLTSFYVPPDRREVLAPLVRRFPAVVMIDVATFMAEIRQLLDHIAHAVETVLTFVLAAGLLVVVAQVHAGIDARRDEAALLRVIGASRATLRRRALAEFTLLGAAAGVLAALLNEAVAAVVNVRLLDAAASWHPVLWWQAPLAGALLVTLAGLLPLRRVWTDSPLLTLRRN
jgi:putative ABC transport system permease protein